jgi:hypothetical protein
MNTDKQTAIEKAPVIANPMFDTALEKLLKNERIVKYLLSIILMRQVVSVDVRSQDFADREDSEKVAPSFGMDFVATLQHEEGKPAKRLVQIRKLWHHVSVNKIFSYDYLCDDAYGRWPITRIYFLKQNFEESKSPCVARIQEFTDRIKNEIIYPDSQFTNIMFKDIFAIQTGRLSDLSFDIDLKRILSIFEQTHFVKQDSIAIKEYRYQQDDENMKLIIDVLHKIAVNPEELKQMEVDEENLRSLNIL